MTTILTTRPSATTRNWRDSKPSRSASSGTKRYSDRRRLRFDRREVLASVTNLPRLAACGRHTHTDSGSVSIKLNAGTAHFDGVVTCGSVWACPVCSAKIRQKRSDDLEQGLLRHLAAGGGGVMVTVTLPHHQGDGLAPLLDALLKVWQTRVVAGRPWLRAKETYGVLETMRAAEVTYSANGWHPHVHALLLTDRPLSAPMVQALGSHVFGKWAAGVSKVLGRECSRAAFRCSALTSESAGVYVTKVQDGSALGTDSLRRASMELLRGDLKSGRLGSLAPFQLLDVVRETGDCAARDLWREYEAATKGRRCMTMSKGCKELLGLVLDDSEATDEALAAEEVGGEALVVLDRDEWRWLRRQRGGPVRLLEAAEARGRAGVLQMLDHLRHPN